MNEIEVELKFPVESLDDLRGRFLALGAIAHLKSVQSDEYLNDSLRDFAKSDKALRIRSSNGIFYLTFKGPNLDPVAKIRQEIEIPLVSEQAARQMKAAFLGMDFFSVAKVVKHRETLTIVWQGKKVEICLDEVEQVGSFCELELLVKQEWESDEAKQLLGDLASEVGLSDPIRTSYLQLLLEKQNAE
jgi:adenylate cyclase class 2